ncbi:hypothetical protein SAY87_011549 [Trapa incisa]|uniref:Uncharacterized protein n=1 Tax=Trapa incisa TaxID=236973 RepID=A0AAN7JIU6_9MYRT|nr:hypothetical protein SAY87_011549 [Trapa incisa]
MESDPFGFITACCRISSSQEVVLRKCRFPGEPEIPSEDECSSSGGAEVQSTGMMMVSPPESTQATRNDNPTSQETYHTPPEESAPPSSASGDEPVLPQDYKDRKRGVELRRDRDPRLLKRTGRTASELHGRDSQFPMEKGRSLKRGLSSHEILSEKRRFSETTESLNQLTSKGTRILEINLRLEAPHMFAGIVKEKIKESLEEALESLTNYRGILRREINIQEVASTERELNLSIKIDDATRIAGLKEVGGSIPEPPTGPDGGEVGLGLNAKVIGSAGDISGFRYSGRTHLSLDKGGMSTAVRMTSGMRSSEEPLKSQACNDPQGESSTRINISVANVQGFKCDPGRKEAGGGRGSLSISSVFSTVDTENDCAREVRGVESFENFATNNGKDKYMSKKGKAIAESDGIGLRLEEKHNTPCVDDHGGQRSALANVQKSKDGSKLKEADRDYFRSVTELEVNDIAPRDHREGAERYNREKDPCLFNNRKSIVGDKENLVRDKERPNLQVNDASVRQKSTEINCSVQSIQNLCAYGTKLDKSPNAGGSRILPSFVNESVQHVPRRVTSKASSCPPKLKEIDIFDVLKQGAKTCEGPSIEHSLVDIAKKRGLTFPRLNS